MKCWTCPQLERDLVGIVAFGDDSKIIAGKLFIQQKN